MKVMYSFHDKLAVALLKNYLAVTLKNCHLDYIISLLDKVLAESGEKSLKIAMNQLKKSIKVINDGSEAELNQMCISYLTPLSEY